MMMMMRTGESIVVVPSNPAILTFSVSSSSLRALKFESTLLTAACKILTLSSQVPGTQQARGRGIAGCNEHKE